MAIASLVVNLKANTASFASGMQRAASLSFKSGKDIERSLAVISKAAVAAGAVVAGGLAAMVKSSLDTADKMYKLSQQTGVSIEQLSGLGHAADLAGVDLETLATSLGKLNKHLFEAAGGKGDAAAAFKTLGINVKDATGHLKSGDQVLSEIADKFSKFKDGPEKAALAMALFGKAGAKMIPLLNGGADGLAEMQEEARRLGLVLDEETGKAAERFNDNIRRMERTVKGAAMQFTAGLVTALDDLVNAFFRVEDRASGFKTFGEGVGEVLKGIARAAVLTQNAIEQAFAFLNSSTHEEWIGLQKALTEQLDETLNRIDGIKRVADGKPFDNLFGGIVKHIKDLKDLPPGIVDAGNAFKFMHEQAAKLAYTLDVVAPTLKTLAERIGSLPLGRMKELSQEMERQRQAIEDRNDTLERGKDITRSVRTAAEVYSDTIADLTEMLNEGAISEETFARAASEAADTMTAAQKKTTDFTRTIGTALEDAILHFENIKSILGGLLEDIARIILRVTITKPFEDWLTGALSGGKSGSSSGGGFNLPGVIKNLFGGFRAAGGPVSPGKSYMVGENGPELFSPGVAGAISPSGGKGVTVVNNYDFRGASSGLEHKLIPLLEQVEERATRRAIATIGQMQFRRA